MKKKFKKIVKWENNIDYKITLIIMLSLSILLGSFGVIENKWYFRLIGLCLIYLIAYLIDNLPSRRNVWYEEI